MDAMQIIADLAKLYIDSRKEIDRLSHELTDAQVLARTIADALDQANDDLDHSHLEIARLAGIADNQRDGNYIHVDQIKRDLCLPFSAIDAINAHKKIEAIKVVKSHFNISLIAAKKIVEAHM